MDRQVMGSCPATKRKNPLKNPESFSKKSMRGKKEGQRDQGGGVDFPTPPPMCFNNPEILFCKYNQKLFFNFVFNFRLQNFCY